MAIIKQDSTMISGIKKIEQDNTRAGRKPALVLKGETVFVCKFRSLNYNGLYMAQAGVLSGIVTCHSEASAEESEGSIRMDISDSSLCSE